MKKTVSYRKSLLLYLVVLSGLTLACDKSDDEEEFFFIDGKTKYNNVQLLGANQRPVVTSKGSGTMNVAYSELTNTIDYTITWELGNPADATTAMHFHGPADANASAPPVVSIGGFSTGYSGTVIGTTRMLTKGEASDLKAGLWYVNIHSSRHPNGELRGNLLKK
ncbi:CHRD domain-containing protein [Pontibacter ummariensis]|uniref:CHRD domain-containing protein n=1 Tax=Pontibacter ummariensis TaxID=1610492 RepID=A0A239K9Z0_9BACT|nr:CHRD domain-containing protein [Pontibacter ummariensis]PRY06064.1 CHRD domain-containing protein [Pontibacter ummariensis]SNT14780.1 CHRD domain-containing protein [Pontibacter ummariensis]